jgi:hypothetical protein
VADVDAAFVQQVLNIPKRKWKANVHHDRQANDLRAAVKVLERVAFCHGTTLRNRSAQLKAICSNSASWRIKRRPAEMAAVKPSKVNGNFGALSTERAEQSKAR